MEILFVMENERWEIGSNEFSIILTCFEQES